jgi:hypothetical protein
MEEMPMTRSALVLAAAWLSVATAWAGPPKIDRTIGKEPAYQTKAPKYGLLLFGPEGKDRVWLVHDGDTLYVDRNSDGDLTEPGKKVTAEKKPGRDSAEDGSRFDVGDVTVGGRTHKGLTVYFTPLQRYANGSLGKRPDVKAALARDPKAAAAGLSADVEVPGMHGGGLGGRLSFSAGPIDLSGVLQFADTPAEAPVVHLGGPLQVTFYGELPRLRVGRGSELVLVVGTPGAGAGTFAMLGYEDAIPRSAKPVADVSLPPAKPGDPPLKEKWEIKDRC